MRPDISLTRRRFLQWAALGAAGLAGGGLWRPLLGGARAAEAEPAVQAADWALTASEFAPAAGGAALSPVRVLPFAFNAAGVAWPPSESAAPQVHLRASHDGRLWTPWRAAHPAHTGDGDAASSDLLLLEGRYLQARVEGAPPAALRITAIDSSAGPAAGEMATVPLPAVPGGGYGLQAIAPPSLSYRGGWGANESYRFKNGREVWPPEYALPKKILVHHTDTANNPTDPAATVRAIYYYHAVTQGWGDIGYNYLIDARGRVYVGRFGGRNNQGWSVLGGHALKYNTASIGIALLGTFSDLAPTSAMMQALVSLAATQAVQYGIHPTGSSYFIDKTLPNICGHRDCLQTSCPGDAMYALLPSLRQQALGALPPLGVAFDRNQIPATMGLGAAVAATVTLRNSGSLPWTRSGAAPFRLGARWQRAGAAPTAAEAGLEVRGDLPKDVQPGQDVTVPLRLQAPKVPGKYEVLVDMVQETVQWFAGAPGNQPLVLPVTVAAPVMKYRQTLPVVGRQGSFEGEALRLNRP